MMGEPSGAAVAGVARTGEAPAAARLGSGAAWLERLERRAPLALVATLVVGFVAILVIGRGATFSADEISFYIYSPHAGSSLRSLLQPHEGHLIFTTRVVYKALLLAFGTNYFAFRLLTALTVVATVALVYAFASPRAGRLPAFGVSVVLLFFGADALHVLRGNGFTVMLPVALGVAALLLLERRERAADVAACALLCLAVVTYSSGLGPAVAAGGLVLLGPGGRRRLWIALVPLGLYVCWFAWTKAAGLAGGSHAAARNVLLIPVWIFQALGANASAVIGTEHGFAGYDAVTGPALAIAAIGALIWFARRRRLSGPFWAIALAPLVWWALQAVASNGPARNPASAHYLYPGAALLVVAAAQAVSGWRWTGGALAVSCAALAMGLTANLFDLDAAARRTRRDYTPGVRAALGALEIAGRAARPDYVPSGRGVDPSLSNALLGVELPGSHPTAAYLHAARRFGGIGYTLGQLRSGAGGLMAGVAADDTLAGALGLSLAPAGRDVRGLACRPGGTGALALPAGGAALIAGATGRVTVVRFESLRLATFLAAGGTPGVPVGTATPGRRFVLRTPADNAEEVPWVVSTGGAGARICRVG